MLSVWLRMLSVSAPPSWSLSVSSWSLSVSLWVNRSSLSLSFSLSFSLSRLSLILFLILLRCDGARGCCPSWKSGGKYLRFHTVSYCGTANSPRFSTTNAMDTTTPPASSTSNAKATLLSLVALSLAPSLRGCGTANSLRFSTTNAMDTTTPPASSTSNAKATLLSLVALSLAPSLRGCGTASASSSCAAGGGGSRTCRRLPFGSTLRFLGFPAARASSICCMTTVLRSSERKTYGSFLFSSVSKPSRGGIAESVRPPLSPSSSFELDFFFFFFTNTLSAQPSTWYITLPPGTTNAKYASCSANNPDLSMPLNLAKPRHRYQTVVAKAIVPPRLLPCV